MGALTVAMLFGAASSRLLAQHKREYAKPRRECCNRKSQRSDID
jgi:hypothetical protein